MLTKKQPLNYAIYQLFMDGKIRCAQDVVDELATNYSGYKMLNFKDIDETLATAKENGLLDEVSAELDSGVLRISYKINDYGRGLIGKYIDYPRDYIFRNQ